MNEYPVTGNFALPLHYADGGMTDGDLHNQLARRLDLVLTSVTAADRRHLYFGKASPISNAFLDSAGGPPSNVAGFPVPSAMALLAIVGTMGIASNCVIEIYKVGTPVPIATLPFVASTYALAFFAIPLVAGDVLQCKASGLANFPNIIVIVG